MNKAPDAWEPYRQAARVKWGRSTAFRLGLAVGEAGLYLASPYPRMRATEHYQHGLKTGHQWRLSAALSRKD
jgi:hypothetical protein